MVQKRPSRDQQGDGDFRIPHQGFNKRPNLRSVIEGLARPAFNEVIWEQFLRRVVREEVELLVFPSNNASSSRSDHQVGPSGGGSGLQLHFIGQLPSTLFTGSKIEPEDPNFILQVILVDTSTESIVRTGQLSSIKVEIVALNGEFGSDEQDDWTQQQFDNSVLRQREGRRPLVAGDLTLTLVEGVGVIGNVAFTDNSSWTRSRRFRLGFRAVSTGGERIREARSDAFVVKDHRGELYKKNHPPHLNDEVWRLEKIAKDGAFHKRLANNKIDTVQAFMRLYTRDSLVLRKMMVKITDRVWMAIVEHAMNCVVDDNKFYAYQSADLNVTLIFNSIYRLHRAIFNGHLLSPVEFTPSQKIVVENLRHHAYKNESALVPMDELPYPGPMWPLAEPLNNQTIDNQLDFQVLPNDQAIALSGLNQASTSNPTPLIGLELNNPQFILSQMHKNSFSREDFFASNYNGQLGAGWPTSGTSQVPIFQTNHLSPDSLFHFQTPSNIISSPWSDQGTGFFLASASNNYETGEAEMFPTIPIVHVSRDRRGRTRWCKIRSAIKCMLMVNATARRMSNMPLNLGY